MVFDRQYHPQSRQNIFSKIFFKSLLIILVVGFGV
jgi:hypothetical protein